MDGERSNVGARRKRHVAKVLHRKVPKAKLERSASAMEKELFGDDEPKSAPEKLQSAGTSGSLQQVTPQSTGRTTDDIELDLALQAPGRDQGTETAQLKKTIEGMAQQIATLTKKQAKLLAKKDKETDNLRKEMRAAEEDHAQELRTKNNQADYYFDLYNRTSKGLDFMAGWAGLPPPLHKYTASKSFRSIFFNAFGATWEVHDLAPQKIPNLRPDPPAAKSLACVFTGDTHPDTFDVETKDMDRHAVLRALTAAFIQEHVFDSEWPNFDENKSGILQGYREIIACQKGSYTLVLIFLR